MERDAADLVRRLSRGRVLVVGDLIYDRHVRGEVRRVSPEAPIQILDVEHEEPSPGGAANVACKVAELGGQAVLAGVVGGDAEGAALRRATEAFGVDCGPVVTDTRPTTTKIRYMARGQQLLRVDNERRAPVSGETEVNLAEAVATELARANAVIIEDYGKGALSPAVLEAALRRAGDIPVVVDPNGTDWSRYRNASGRGPSVITPNARELGAAAPALAGKPSSGGQASTFTRRRRALPAAAGTQDGGPELVEGAAALKARREIKGEDDIVTAARSVLDGSGAGAIAVTRGPDGITIVTRDGVEDVPTAPVEVYDVTGAGDAVVAAFALALAGGISMREAAAVANLAGGVVVRQLGVGRMSREKLIDAARGPGGSAARKVVSLDETVREAALARASGREVVFTNGVFDLLQPRHVYVLEESRKRGGFLIVGLNSDESVRRVKGPGRPAQSEAERARLVAALACVDLVVIFDEDTPRRLIETVRPDVLVKGGDYAEDEVVGAQFVKSCGGRVEIVPRVDADGTSDIIARVKADSVAEKAEKREWRDE